MVTNKLEKTGVAKLHQAMTGYVERNDVPGIVTLVGRGDDVAIHAVGVGIVGQDSPLKRDTIFRIASLTKPIAAVGAMILVDDGKFDLDDSVEEWLPELANRRVLRSIASPLDDTVPANRSITVRDLLTSCFGFGSVMAWPDTYPIQRPIREGHLGGDGPPQPSKTPATDEWMRRLGDLPLMYQPGERWAYNTSCDVLGVLVARASGKTFGAFLRERLFEPLGMNDTAFSVPDSKFDRLPNLYWRDRETGQFEIFDPAKNSEYGYPPAFESGAGGLVSTADDYYAFCRMLLNRGTAKGERILSEASVEAMTRDQLTPAQRVDTEMFFGDHSSWGFGMAVDIRQEKPWTVPGRFGWNGGFGTSAYADPSHDFVGILLTQCMMDSPEPPAVFDDFWAHAYETFPR